MVKRFNCTTHYEWDGSYVVTVISCAMIDETEAEKRRREYLAEGMILGRLEADFDKDRVLAEMTTCELCLVDPNPNALDHYYRHPPADS